MNLNTEYLGLKLRNPLIVGASPFCDSTAVAQQFEDAGAAAIVMRSLFEEQIETEQRALAFHMEAPAECHAEATSYFVRHDEYLFQPDVYLRRIGEYKKTLTIPVIASLNGCRPGGWIDYARRFECAGADAIELNLYQLATDPTISGANIEAEMLATVASVVQSVKVPVAVKLSPFHTAPAEFVLALEKVGDAGAVLFNRLYQPDFNLEDLEVNPQIKLSDSSELLLRLRWLAIISPHKRGSLAASGGVHTAEDVIKALLAGADVVQLVSVLLRYGPQVISLLLTGLNAWMDDHGYANLDELRGAMNLKRCPDASAFERANYIRILQSWKV